MVDIWLILGLGFICLYWFFTIWEKIEEYLTEKKKNDSTLDENDCRIDNRTV